jgi:hypothetical protein
LEFLNFFFGFFLDFLFSLFLQRCNDYNNENNDNYNCRTMLSARQQTQNNNCITNKTTKSTPVLQTTIDPVADALQTRSPKEHQAKESTAQLRIVIRQQAIEQQQQKQQDPSRRLQKTATNRQQFLNILSIDFASPSPTSRSPKEHKPKKRTAANRY